MFAGLGVLASFTIPLIVIAILIAITAVAFMTYKVPRGNEALIITGFGTRGDNRAPAGADAPPVSPVMSFKVVTGRGAFVLPVIQRSARLRLDSRSVDLGEHGKGLACVSSQAIPVDVEAVMVFKIANDRASIANAATRFLDATEEDLNTTIKDIAHGHLRTVVSGLTVSDLIGDRTRLTDAVRDATAVEMQRLGLQIDSFQVKGIRDPRDGQSEGYIENLGKPEAAAVAAAARIAAAQREQEAAQSEAESKATIAEAERNAAVRQAAAQSETDIAQAKANQAGPQAEAEARQAVVEANTRAAQLEARLQEERLQTEVRKPADAEAYRQVTLAQAAKETQIADAEAEAARTKLAAEAQAQATQQVGEATAKATELNALAEAKGIREKGLSEAAGIEARQQALAENAEGVIAQQIAEQLPKIVEAAARQYDNVDQLVVLDGAEGMSRALLSTIGVAGAILPAAKQLLEAGGKLTDAGSADVTPTAGDAARDTL